MANYVKSTNFYVKDALLTGNPAKIIKGIEIDDEYDNIAIAVNSKADLTSPTFTGAPLAPTAPSGTNTTQLATTAFVQNIAGSLGTISSQNANAVAITGGTITGLSSPLPVASGGTGVNTSTGSGSTVLSTSPTLVTPALGTPSAIVLTNATGTANALNAGIGVNQTWQNVSGSRAFSTDYTNNTSKPIFVKVTIYSTGGVSAFSLDGYVNGVLIGATTSYAANANYQICLDLIVPVGSTYKFLTSGTGGTPTIRVWAELR